jgi:hypothetical protein
MTPVRTIAAGAALLLVLAANPAQAAWNNAFQLCCHHCRSNTHSYYAPPVAAACCPPPPCCTTSYVQRCYYQAVTTYKTVCEPVTTYRTSYYCEPVTTYRSSCYYDPCTCQSVQVTIPVTSYRLRSQCNAVTSYVQRCVPVTAYKPHYYLEAVTSCVQPAPCPNPCGPGGVSEAAPGGGGSLLPRTNVPIGGVDEHPPANGGTINPGSFRPAFPGPAVPSDPLPRRQIDPTRLDHVVSRPVSGSNLNGQVVANNSTFPVGGAKLVFVSKQGETSQQAVTTDGAGRFQVNLPSGGWSIYMSRPDGMMEYHSTLAVRDNESRNVRVVSR